MGEKGEEVAQALEIVDRARDAHASVMGGDAREPRVTDQWPPRAGASITA